jgi:hypothetical protein
MLALAHWFNVLAATIGTIAFWKVALIKSDPMEVAARGGYVQGIRSGQCHNQSESAMPYEALAIFAVVLLNAVMG